MTELEICDIYEGYNRKTIEMLDGGSCNAVFEDSTIFARVIRDLKVGERFDR